MADEMNPAEQPSPFAAPAGSANPVPEQRPKLLTFIAVVAIIMGAISLIGGVGGFLNMVIGESFQGNFIKGLEDQLAEDPDSEEIKFQLDIQRATRDTTAKYRVANSVLAVVALIVGAALLAGAIMALQRSPLGRTVLIAACLLTLIGDLGKAGVQFLVRREMMEVMSETMPGAITSNPQMSDEQRESVQGMMSGFMRAIKIAMLVWIIAWMTIKAVFYLYSAYYLARRDVKEYFEPAPVADLVN